MFKWLKGMGSLRELVFDDLGVMWRSRGDGALEWVGARQDTLCAKGSALKLIAQSYQTTTYLSVVPDVNLDVLSSSILGFCEVECPYQVSGVDSLFGRLSLMSI